MDITLSAIIFSGVLLFFFGALRMGAMSEFFPATALQGMLAAIGIGILAKQFHLMLGIRSVSGGTIDQLLTYDLRPGKPSPYSVKEKIPDFANRRAKETLPHPQRNTDLFLLDFVESRDLHNLVFHLLRS